MMRGEAAIVDEVKKFLAVTQPGGLHNIRTSECRRSFFSRNFRHVVNGFWPVPISISIECAAAYISAGLCNCVQVVF
jgi:hypothetical protein